MQKFTSRHEKAVAEEGRLFTEASVQKASSWFINLGNAFKLPTQVPALTPTTGCLFPFLENAPRFPFPTI